MTSFPKTGDRLPLLPAFAMSMEQVKEYLAASGDDNDIHTNLASAARLGLPACPVPGLMVVGRALEIARLHFEGFVISDIASRFIAPIPVGTLVSISGRVVQSTPQNGKLTLRLIIASPGPAVLIEVKLQGGARPDQVP